MPLAVHLKIRLSSVLKGEPRVSNGYVVAGFQHLEPKALVTPYLTTIRLNHDIIKARPQRNIE